MMMRIMIMTMVIVLSGPVAGYDLDIVPRPESTELRKLGSRQTSTAAEITPGPVITPRPASKTSEMLNISEHPQSRRRLGWHRWRRIFLPSEKINRSRIMSFNTGGSWTQACTNELPQHSSNELPSTGQKCSTPSTFLAFPCMIR